MEFNKWIAIHLSDNHVWLKKKFVFPLKTEYIWGFRNGKKGQKRNGHIVLQGKIIEFDRQINGVKVYPVNKSGIVIRKI